jgi:hypothetical protein
VAPNRRPDLHLAQRQTAPNPPARSHSLLRRNNYGGTNSRSTLAVLLQRTEVEAAFKSLKDDLSLRPIYHQLEHRIEAHIFIALQLPFLGSSGWMSPS